MKLNKLNIYNGKKVLITGHTGFKGSWLTQWLLILNARVYGFALKPLTTPSLYEQLGNDDKIDSSIGDIRDFNQIKEKINHVKPDIIFHLAAQALVRDSYINPLETLETNLNGTANLLESVRQLKLSTNIIIVTSDKCYDNKEWVYGYRENDAMGGYDPYSASKGATELIVSSWRNSFFNMKNFNLHKVKLASVRAGNVIGGGDWSKDRIVPDCMRFLQDKETIKVRNPLATRPWQHVLESLGGYLLLGTKLLVENDEKEYLQTYCSAFNFGPNYASNKSVETLVDEILKHWKGTWEYNKETAVHEAFLLNLSIDKATQLLEWKPVWDFKTTIKKTVEWYKGTFENSSEIQTITVKQIKDYEEVFIKKNNLSN